MRRVLVLFMLFGCANEPSHRHSGAPAPAELSLQTCTEDEILRYVAGGWSCDLDRDSDTDTVLTEVEVDGFVSDNGYALESSLAAVATSGDFADLANVPADQDTTLTEGDVDAYVANNGYALEASLAPVALSGDYADLVNTPIDQDTQLSEGQVDAYVADNGYALEASLAPVAMSGDHADLINVPPDQDSLAALSVSCMDAEVPQWDALAGVWTCEALPVDTTLDEAQVDAYVANNGYLTAAEQPHVGEVRFSLLSEADFQALYGPSWMLLAGQDITGSALAGYGFSSLPDARGRFLRAKDHGAGANPDGDSPVGTVQGDALASHSHTEARPLAGGTVANGNIGPYTWSITQGSNTGPAQQTGPAGGAETRPANVTVNVFVKIDE